MIREGDMRDVLRAMAAAGETVHAVVTDPPYHLTSMVKRFGREGAADRKLTTNPETQQFSRIARGFMGKKWDGGDIAMQPDTWRLCWDVLPPGGHLVAFGGTRTFHRMAVAIENAGFEIRDTLMWLYGSGFPKSHNQDGAWEGWGTALKPAWEPIILARKPLAGTVADGLAAHRVGALHVDGCRIEGSDKPVTWASPRGGIRRTDAAATAELRTSSKGRWPANVLHDGSAEVEAAFAAFGEKTSGTGAVKRATDAGHQGNALGRESRPPGTPNLEYGDSGSASRFFYCAKASRTDRNEGCEDLPPRPSSHDGRTVEINNPNLRTSMRNGNHHPTVKPTALMRWLARLVTPPGGTVLDPFAGSGSTGKACALEGFRFIGVEADPDYAEIARRRLAYARRSFAATLLWAVAENDDGQARARPDVALL